MSRAQLTSTVEQNSAGVVSPNAAGKNKIINGGFDIWQRGTTYGGNGYNGADRWYGYLANTVTATQSTNVPTGIGVRYSVAYTTGASSSYANYGTALEQSEVIPMRGKTVCVSWYMMSAGTFSGNFGLTNIFYSNASDAYSTTTTSVSITGFGPNGITPTTSWARYYAYFTIPNDAVGLTLNFNNTLAQASGATLYLTGIQMEVGSVPSSFSRAGGNIGGELALCQRYYNRFISNTYTAVGFATQFNSTTARMVINLPVSLRSAPSVSYTGTLVFHQAGNPVTITGLSTTFGWAGSAIMQDFTISGTAGQSGSIYTNGSTSHYVEISSEL